MNGFSRFFVRLRWKLMLAYSGITVLAVVLVFFVSVAVQSWSMVYRSGMPGYQLQEDLQALRLHLRDVTRQEDGSAAAIEESLRRFVEEGAGRDPDRNPVMTITLARWNVRLLAVIDERGRVVATYPAGAVPPGSSLRQPFPPEGDIVINDTLFGTQGSAGEGLRDPDSGDLFVGIPLLNTGDQPPGGIVLRYRPNLRDVLLNGTAPLRYFILPVLIFSVIVGTLFGSGVAWWITRRLGRITSAAGAWSRADFSRSIRDGSGDEIGTLARTLNTMAEELQNLMATRGELAAVEERNRVARDLHDSVKQQIFAAALQVGAARELLRDDPPGASEALGRAESMIRDAGRGLTGLIRELRPVELEGKGIAAALRTYAARWSNETGIRAEVRVRGERPTPLRLEQELFRVAQEALNNVARHSGANRAELQLSWESDRLRFTVTDNGRGLPAGQTTAVGPGAGSGIRNMRERMAAVGGTLELEGSGPGTRVIASVDLDRSPDSAETEAGSARDFETPSKG